MQQPRSPLEHRYDVRQPLVALTFDDGPSEWTHRVLHLLERHDGQATFFALGSLAVERPDTLRHVVAAGSEVGNHTFSHRSLPTLEAEVIRDELERAGAVIEAAIGSGLRYWRPPFFHVDERVRAVASPLGLREAGCSIMPGDWEWAADETCAFVLERLRPGSIVCLHDGRPPDEAAELSRPTREETVAAVGLILEGMSARGLRSVTLSELLAAD